MDCGISCPKCGGRRLPTLWTRRRGAKTVRIRVCRACRYRIRTVEIREGATKQNAQGV